MQLSVRQGIKSELDRLNNVSKDKNIITEESTKMSLIVPIIKLLGYDIFNPSEFCAEYTADITMGIKNSEKVDYCILHNSKPVFLLECKSIKEKNLDKHVSQLFRYFAVTNCEIGILTNGVEWRFYSDLEKTNIMDSKPFYVFRLNRVRDIDIDILMMFSKSMYNNQSVKSALSFQNIQNKNAEVYKKQFENFFSSQEKYIDIDFANIIFNMIFHTDIPKSDIDVVLNLMKEAIISSKGARVEKNSQILEVKSQYKDVPKQKLVGDLNSKQFNMVELFCSRTQISFYKIISIKGNNIDRDINSWAEFLILIFEILISRGVTKQELFSLDTSTNGWIRDKFNGAENNCQKFVELSNGVWINTYGNAQAMSMKMYRICNSYSDKLLDMYVTLKKIR